MSIENVGSGDHRLAVDVRGEGVPVVFVHGSSGGLTSWEPVAAELRAAHMTVGYARAAYPPSRRRPGPMPFADEVADLLAVVEAVCDEPPHLAGGSYGATLALHAALVAPSAWRSVTVFEPPLFAAGPALRPVLERHRAEVERQQYATASWLFAAEVARMPLELLGPRPAESTDPQPDESAAALAAGCAAGLAAMVDDTPDLERWRALAPPVLLMQGEESWEPIPETMTALRQVLPESTRHVVLPGQSHFATHTAPGQFAAVLRSFFDAEAISWRRRVAG